MKSGDLEIIKKKSEEFWPIFFVENPLNTSKSYFSGPKNHRLENISDALGNWTLQILAKQWFYLEFF
jgi:hypothetical protein